jgi:hypothetical protein
LVYSGKIESPQTLGVLGQETWFVTKFTVMEDPSLAIYLGLQGEEQRWKLAQTFLRPTTWGDYCTQVSNNNCTVPTNITQRPPRTPEEELQYYNAGGNYIGHFRATDDNDCIAHPTTCTGHIADFPCNWDSFVGPQLHYLNISLTSTGPELPAGGYPHARLVEMWRAANATQSNLMMHYWTPEALVQEFAGTDAEFVRVSMPPPSQQCQDARRPETDQCNADVQLRLGSPLGICEESAKNLYKLIVGNLYDVTHAPHIPEPIHNPAYDALRLFQISELQLGQIFDYHRTEPTPRDAVCRWMVENIETLQTFVPRTYPRLLRNSNTNRDTVDPFVYTAMILGSIAILFVLVTWYLVHKNRTMRAIRLAQIEFLHLLLTGLLLVAIGSILVALPPTNATCIMMIWCINFGYTLELVPLIVKVAAVNKLLGAARQFRRVVVSRKSLFTTMLAISTGVFLFLLIWTIIDPPSKNEEYALTSDVTQDGYTMVDVSYYCSSQSQAWDYVAVGWNTLLLLCATVLAFQTRTLQKDFNESQTLAFLIYSHFVFVVLRLITVLLQTPGNSANTSDAKLSRLRSFIFSIDTVATIVIYFVPKFSTSANKPPDDRFHRSSTFGLQNFGDLSSRGIEIALPYDHNNNNNNNNNVSNCSSTVAAANTYNGNDGRVDRSDDLIFTAATEQLPSEEPSRIVGPTPPAAETDHNHHTKHVLFLNCTEEDDSSHRTSKSKGYRQQQQQSPPVFDVRRRIPRDYLVSSTNASCNSDIGRDDSQPHDEEGGEEASTSTVAVTSASEEELGSGGGGDAVLVEPDMATNDTSNVQQHQQPMPHPQQA